MPPLTLIHGDSTTWEGHADLVFSNLYGPLPGCLVGLPALVTLYLPAHSAATRIRRARAWTTAQLTEIGRWGDPNRPDVLFAANIEARPVDLSDLKGEQVYAGGACFPEAMPERVLDTYADLIPEGAVVWDGFMGRGTVGKAALARGYGFVGIDRRRERVEIARHYLAREKT